MNCPACGQKIPEGMTTVYCPHCGKKLEQQSPGSTISKVNTDPDHSVTPPGNNQELVSSLNEISKNLDLIYTEQYRTNKKLDKLQETTSGLLEIQSDPTEVTLVDINITFGSMVSFMVKWSLAAIPAGIVIAIIMGGIYVLVLLILRGLSILP